MRDGLEQFVGVVVINLKVLLDQLGCRIEGGGGGGRVVVGRAVVGLVAGGLLQLINVCNEYLISTDFPASSFAASSQNCIIYSRQ